MARLQNIFFQTLIPIKELNVVLDVIVSPLDGDRISSFLRRLWLEHSSCGMVEVGVGICTALQRGFRRPRGSFLQHRVRGIRSAIVSGIRLQNN